MIDASSHFSVVPTATPGETGSRELGGVGAFVTGVAVSAAVAVVLSFFAKRRLQRGVDGLASIMATIGSPGSADEVDRLARSSLPVPLAPILAEARRGARSAESREAALIARLRELEAILHSTANGFIALDPQQRVLDLNSAGAAMLGVSGVTVRGRLLQEVARQPALNRFVQDAMARSAHSEADVHLEGDSARSAQATAEPLRDASGRAVGILVSLQDVTRLRQLESLRSDFVANVSHELRTPITSIKGYVETLLQIGPADSAQVRKFLEIVHRNAVRLSSLVEDLLALASLEQGETDSRNPIEFTIARAEEIADEVCEQHAPRAEARGMRLTIRAEPDLLVVANRILVEQALGNLVSNAIRYAPEGSPIEIGLRAIDAHHVEFAVNDRGPGIPAKHLHRIFERFYRADRSRARTPSGDGGGTGLGLAIVKHIAQAHGGRVEVESDVGSGSTFRLILRRPGSAAVPT